VVDLQPIAAGPREEKLATRLGSGKLRRGSFPSAVVLLGEMGAMSRFSGTLSSVLAILFLSVAVPAVAAPTPVFHLDFSEFVDRSPSQLEMEVGDGVSLVANGGPLLSGGMQLHAARWEGVEDETNQILIFDNPILDAVATGAGSIATWIKPVDGDEWNNIAKTPCEDNLEPCESFGEFWGIEFQASGPHAGVFGAVQGWSTNNFGPDSPPPYGNGDGSSDTPSGEWTHVALVWNEVGDHTIFVNAQPGATVFGVGDDEFGLNEPQDWTIGGDGLGTTGIHADAYRYLNGDLADFAIFNQALTPADLADIMANGILSGGLAGDFNADGTLTTADIDDLTGQSAAGTHPAAYDLNGDALVNSGDIGVWIKDYFNSWVGDADLNGQFNSTDLVAVLASGSYEANIDSVWSTGDFNGDGRTNSGDLVAALADGGYELGPRAAVAAVPEPVSATLLLLGLIGALLPLRSRETRA
jgi:hypothetical protein